MINGVHEFAEVFFDDVVVPADRMLGEVNGGWAVAMSILPYERSSCFWQRIAYLYRRLERLVEVVPPTTTARAEVVGNAFLQLHALRARSRATQHRLAAGATLGAETSIDKVLVATAEQATYDAVRRLLPGVVETRRQRRRRDVAQRVPLLARRDDLRRHRRGAAQHHRPPAARPRAATTDGRGRARAARDDGPATQSRPRRATPAAVDAVLAELGWLEMLDAEPRDAIDDRVQRARRDERAVDGARRRGRLARSASTGAADLAVLLPPFASWGPPGALDRAGSLRAGLATARAATATRVARRRSRRRRSCTVTVAMTDVDGTPVRGIDPDAGLHTVHVDRRRPPVASIDPDAWDTAVALAQRARRAPDRRRRAARCSTSRARTRSSGCSSAGPIARFQAVRHRLADALVAVEALEATLAAAERRAGLRTTAALAKATAGRTARTVAAHCQQVLAGIGFTTDHPFHRFLKRTMLLDGLFGSADDARRRPRAPAPRDTPGPDAHRAVETTAQRP